jgi:hypothetical protein
MTNDNFATADNDPEIDLPKGIRGSREFRAPLNAAAGAIPFVGGLLAAGAGAWSEQEQGNVNAFLSIGLKCWRPKWQRKHRRYWKLPHGLT